MIIVNHPYYTTIKVRGARKIVFTPTPITQSFINKLFTGRIIYQIIQEWPCVVEITPNGKKMRFKCPSGKLVSTPSASWEQFESYKLVNAQTGQTIIELSIN